MGRTIAVFFAALLGPFLFVAGYLVAAHLANWPVGPTGDKITELGGVLAGITPILFAQGKLWARGLIAGLYAYPSAMAATFYSLLLSCSMFRQCLS